MRKYEVIVDYTMTAAIVVEARDEESARNKAARFIHTKKGFDEYVKTAAPLNVSWSDRSCSGGDGFDVSDVLLFYGMHDGCIEI